MSAHKVLQEILACDKSLPDPGVSGAIVVDRSPSIVELTATAEGRTLPDPSSEGMILVIYAKSIVTLALIVAATAVNASGHTSMSMDTNGQTLVFVSVSDGSGGFKWWLIVNVGSVTTS